MTGKVAAITKTNALRFGPRTEYEQPAPSTPDRLYSTGYRYFYGPRLDDGAG
jgi:hypothetical protein